MKWMFVLTALLVTCNQLVECSGNNNLNKNKNSLKNKLLLNGNSINRNTYDNQDGQGGSLTTILGNSNSDVNMNAEFEKFLAEFNRKKSQTMSKSSGGNNNGAYSFLNYILSDETKRDVNCQNPDVEYLENQFSEYQRFYRKFVETSLKSKGEMLNSNFDPDNHSMDHLRDESQCNINDRNTTSINKRSICPWNYVISARMDKFPPIKTEAKCTCSKCTLLGNGNLPENIYNCMPVMRTMPVLVKGGCGPDGYYIWTPTTEEVNVACICGVTYAFYPQG